MSISFAEGAIGLRMSAPPGAVVRVVGPDGKFVARALFSDQSQITLRVLTRQDVPIDRVFWRERLASAAQFRRQLSIDATALVARRANDVKATSLSNSSSKLNVGSATGHVGGDSDSSFLSRLRDDFSFFVVILCV